MKYFEWKLDSVNSRTAKWPSYSTSFVRLPFVVNSLVLTTIIFLLPYLYEQYSRFTPTTIQNPRYSNCPTVFHRAILSLPFYRRTFSRIFRSPFDPPLTDTGTSSARMFRELRFENYVSYFHRERERERGGEKKKKKTRNTRREKRTKKRRDTGSSKSEGNREK